MKKPTDRPVRPALFKAKAAKAKSPKGTTSRDAADAPGDFYYDELMTPQPDSMREFLRSRLMKPARPDKKKP